MLRVVQMLVALWIGLSSRFKAKQVKSFDWKPTLPLWAQYGAGLAGPHPYARTYTYDTAVCSPSNRLRSRPEVQNLLKHELTHAYDVRMYGHKPDSKHAVCFHASDISGEKECGWARMRSWGRQNCIPPKPYPTQTASPTDHSVRGSRMEPPRWETSCLQAGLGNKEGLWYTLSRTGLW